MDTDTVIGGPIGGDVGRGEILATATRGVPGANGQLQPRRKHLNVRRYFIFPEHSINQGTQWVLIETNNEML